MLRNLSKDQDGLLRLGFLLARTRFKLDLQIYSTLSINKYIAFTCPTAGQVQA
jgi:hypothetical protein